MPPCDHQLIGTIDFDLRISIVCGRIITAASASPLGHLGRALGDCSDDHPDVAVLALDQVGPVIAVARDAADARAFPAHHQPIAVVLDFVNPERAGRRSDTFDGRQGSMKPEGRCTIMGDASSCAAAPSSLSAPRMTILSASSGSPCNAFASSHGARIQTSRSSSVIRITGMAFGWIGSTTAFGDVVRNP